MHIRKVVATNTIAQTITKLASSGSAFIISFIIAKSIGAEGYGAYSMVVTYVAFFYLFADFGLNAIFIQTSSEKHPSLSEHFSVLFFTRLGIALVLTILSIILTVFLPHSGQTQGYTPDIKIAIIVFSLSIILQSTITSFQGYLQRSFQYSVASVATTIGSFISLIFVILLFVFKEFLTVHAFITFLLVAQLMGLVGVVAYIFFWIRYQIHISLASVTKQDVMTYLSSSLPLGITLLCNLVYFRIDSVIMGSTRPLSETGMYNFSYKIFEVVLTLPTFFMNSVFPLLTTSSGQVFLRLIRKSALLLLCISICSIVCVWVCTPLVSILFPQFPLSPLLLRILSLGFPFYFLSGLTMWLLIARKHQIILMKIYILSMAFNIVANMVFIPRGGSIAAAIITVVSEAFVLLLSFGMIRKLKII